MAGRWCQPKLGKARMEARLAFGHARRHFPIMLNGSQCSAVERILGYGMETLRTEVIEDGAERDWRGRRIRRRPERLERTCHGSSRSMAETIRAIPRNLR
jgi:hypothetical protein